jgi:hypothetical protein
MGVKVTGLRAIQRKLSEVVTKAETALDQALEDEGINIVGLSRPVVPVDTGLTRDTMFVEQRAPLRWQVGYQTPYAPIIHVTHKSKANWFGDVVDAERAVFAQSVRDNLRRRLGIS